MPGDVPDEVTCEVCGTTFDPTQSRGWCPNTDCGEWQHPAFPLDEGGSGDDSSVGIDALTKTCPNCGKDVRADANFCKYCAHQFDDEPADEDEGEEEADTGPRLDECPDCGADLSRIPSERLSDCPICGTNLEEVMADADEPEVTPADLDDCPQCGEDLTSIPEDMRLVCPSCRVDLEDAIEAQQEEQAASEPAPDPAPTGGGDPDPTPDRGTGGTEERDIEMATQIQSTAEEVVLEVMGREIRAGDGDVVGRGIRTAMVEGGASEEDAVYIHREHARFDRENDDFYVTRLGENSLKLNGRTVGKNERAKVEDGDELSFSEVVTAKVRLE